MQFESDSIIVVPGGTIARQTAFMATTAHKKTVLGGVRGGNILEFYAEEFKPQASPIGLFRQHLASWFFAARLLRIFEANKLTSAPAEEDLASHRVACSALITFGEYASIFARKQPAELDLQSLGITVESIEAETRLLRDNFRMFHDQTMSEQEAESVLMALNEA